MGSLAFSAWRHGRVGCDVHVHASPDTLKLERQSYYGGRAEVWQLGPVPGPIYQLDVNSLYPWIASKVPVPVRHIATGCYTLSQVDRYLHTGYGAVATCEVETKDYEYPLRRKGKTSYARGRFRTCLAGPELQYALEHDHLRSVGYVATYELGNPMGEWLTYLYALRCRLRDHGNLAGAGLCKALLVGLVGRFASKDLPWVEVKDRSPAVAWDCWDEVDFATGKVQHYRNLGGKVERQLAPVESADSFPVITAYVCSAGRLLMHSIKEIAEHSNIFYEDADCVHTSSDGYQLLSDSGLVDRVAFGSLKLAKTCESAYYYGVRDYQLDATRVKAGVNKCAEPFGANSFRASLRSRPASIFDQLDPATISMQELLIHPRTERYRGRTDSSGRVQPLYVYD